MKSIGLSPFHREIGKYGSRESMNQRVGGMSQTRLTVLTAEQLAWIPELVERWSQISNGTHTDRLRAEQSIRQVYRAAGLEEPIHFVWVADPVEALQQVWQRAPRPNLLEPGESGRPPSSTLKFEIHARLQRQVQQILEAQVSPQVLSLLQQKIQLPLLEQSGLTWRPMWNQVRIQLRSEAWVLTRDQARAQTWGQPWEAWRAETRQNPLGWMVDQAMGWIWQSVQDQDWLRSIEAVWVDLWQQVSEQIYDASFRPEDGAWLALYEYLWQVGGVDLGLLTGSFEAARSCGWWWPFKYWVLVCPKPERLLRDDQGRIHAEARPAIVFSGSEFRTYAWQGVTLPERYGNLPTARWSAEWLLQEQNAELRRVLIQGLGYGRIVQELGAQEIDRWREYQLLEIPHGVDVEPIRLLKMTCPSTHFIHVVRVPPHLNTAKAAIQWCNWDVDPEEFAQES